MLSLLCINIKAQEKNLIDYPFRDIPKVYLTTSQSREPRELPRLNGPCFFIKTLDEFYKIFPKRGITIVIGKNPEKPPINFSNEIVLGVVVSIEYFAIPDYNFQVMQDINTKDIHFFVYYYDGGTRRGKGSARTWIAVPKPDGDYQVHFHLVNGNITTTRIFEGAQ